MSQRSSDTSSHLRSVRLRTNTMHLLTRGASGGVIAGTVSIAVAHFVASFSRHLHNPVLDVGDRVVDLVPSPVKQFAIEVFGTADKAALLIGIGILLTLYAAGVGILALRRGLAFGIGGIGLFGLVGAASATAGPAGAFGATPSLFGAAFGILALKMTTHSATVELDPHTAASRRSFLRVSGTLTMGAIALGGAGFALDRRFDVAPGAAVLPPVDVPLRPIPPEVSFPEASPFITANDEFYRIDTALTVPRVDPETYVLEITGMVEQPLSLSYRELVDRPLVESDITLTCVSNEVGGSLVGNARWLGVRLDDLLAEAGIAPVADQVVGRSVDRYTCGFPVAALDGRDALVAVGMNGGPLPAEHGFPARLIVPGLYGYVSATKWLAEIELTTFASFDHYWVDRGWAVEAPIKTQSRIDTPAPLSRLAAGTTAVAGVAWAQTRGIQQVEVRVDDGPWMPADLASELNDTTWRQWKTTWEATPGRHEIACRATDGNGNTQTETRTRPIPNGASGWHSIVVFVDG